MSYELQWTEISLLHSLQPLIELLNSLIKILELKQESFDVFKPVPEINIEIFWKILLQIEQALKKGQRASTKIN